MFISIDFENKRTLFRNPKNIISCFNHQEFNRTFAKIENLLNKGFYLAGFISYEAGHGFEEQLCKNSDYDFPLVYFGAFEKPIKENLEKNSILDGNLKNIKLNISKEDYFKNIISIKDYIAKGEVYQVTYCIKLLFEYDGDHFSLYSKLLHDQPVPYPAFIQTNNFSILSLSPELFFKKTGSYIITKPMKGTWSRGKNIFFDIFAKYKLKYDPKNRAENIMICDLMRNDLGKIGNRIIAPKLFEIAGYTTLFQMTSTVTANINSKIKTIELFRALHPSGSVTGAPKIRSMQIIKELEKEERRIYTGAIGYITPEKNMFFNVPIRTLLIKKDTGEMGIGGGIVWDSTPQGEFEEGMLKAKFLMDFQPLNRR